MDIKNSRIVVAGGTGGVGEGIVRALLAAGATVAVTTRSESNVAKLRSYVQDVAGDRLHAFIGGFSTEQEALSLAQTIKNEFGEADVVVASLGGWTQGQAIPNVSMQTWENVIRDNLTSHFLAMKALFPLLAARRGRYVHINGSSAEMSYPGAGPVAAMAAAQKSLALTLAKEVGPIQVKVNELILPPINTRQRMAYSKQDFLSAVQVGEYIGKLIESDDNEVLHYLDR
ncbi:SDR family NAD(P)-dependent oxidoreductase [Stenotrophomonas maltophilia]|uniref:SDR family NAD(P)-dependent oxidoreductase n=1 Tax=Stenotrophomonas maltophilia TaxID=40324 RepID=UPI002A9723AE|nr:SDR family oxidoreductase [Stenotrophomonas maltophilia]